MVELEIFNQGTYDELSPWYCFLHAKKWSVWKGAFEGIWEELRSGNEAFGRSTKCGPPAWPGFLEEKEFGTILRTNEAGWNDFRII